LCVESHFHGFAVANRFLIFYHANSSNAILGNLLVVFLEEETICISFFRLKEKKVQRTRNSLDLKSVSNLCKNFGEMLMSPTYCVYAKISREIFLLLFS
jgi:hypothetical protein